MPQGFRAFEVNGDGEQELFLQPSAVGKRGVPLEYPATEATCSKHRAPGPDCSCGYYAYNWLGGSSDYLDKGTAGVMAEVWGYGKVEVHENGWRAQRMQIIRFYHPLCDLTDGSRRCMRPAASWFDSSDPQHRGDWPKTLQLACDRHPMESRVGYGSGWSDDDDDEPVYDEGEQVSLGMVTPSVPILARPIESFIRLLADKFQASVFDIDATLEVFQHNKAWHTQMRETQRERAEVEERKRQEKALRLTARQSLPGLEGLAVQHKSNCWTVLYADSRWTRCNCAAQKWVTA